MANGAAVPERFAEQIVVVQEHHVQAIMNAVQEQFAEQVAVTEQHQIVRIVRIVSAVQRVKWPMKTAMANGSAVQKVRYIKIRIM